MKRLIILVFCILFATSVFAQTSSDNSPFNPKNSPFNPDNSPFNPNNSPFNPDNSRFKPNNDRIIYGNDGQAKGYAVPKDDGGTNYYDFSGNRTGYDTAD